MSFEYPFPPISYEDDGRLIVDLEQRYIANVRTAENKAAIEAIREWAKEKGNVTFMEIPEETLVKLLMAGSMVLERAGYIKSLMKEFKSLGDVPEINCPLCGAVLSEEFYHD